MPISSRDPAGLPAPAKLRRLMQSLAVLDAILSPEWLYRYYSFNSKWAPGEQMGSMRNGSGDDYHAVFTEAGCFLKGFWHESPMSPYRVKPSKPWLGLFDGVPPEFAPQLKQPAFMIADTTFCLWRAERGRKWGRGPVEFPPGDDPDSSAKFLAILDGKPQTYCDYADDYFEKPWVTRRMVRHVYDHRPLTDEFLAKFDDPDADGKPVRLKQLAKDLAEIGYPH